MTTTSNRHGSATVSLPSDTEILITRQFDAPASLVFKAFTTPELVKRWWGFDSSQWLVCDIDLRPGGNWRYLIKEGDMEVGFHGEYREIDEPTRIVSTEAFEGLAAMGITDDPDSAASVNTMTLDEVDGVTTMTTRRQARHQGTSRRAHPVGHGGRHADLLQPPRGRRRRIGEGLRLRTTPHHAALSAPLDSAA